MDEAMMKALEEDGKKLRQLTGEDHGPWQLIWDEINTLGGYRPTERNYEQGYVDAISDALAIIEKRLK